MKAGFTVERREQSYLATMTLLNPDRRRVEYLGFSLAMPLEEDSLRGGTLVERQGDWHRILIADPDASSLKLTFAGKGALPKGTDYPSGVYAETPQGRLDVELTRPARYDGESIGPLLPEVFFIPGVKHTLSVESIAFPQTLFFRDDRWNCAWLQRLFSRLDSVEPVAIEQADSGGWKAVSQQDTTLSDEFALVIDASGARLTYRSESGFFQGQSFLFQYLLQWGVHRRLPACDVRDTPSYEYRGIHLDVVRHFFRADEIKAWWDVLALFQYNAFHWHLTDDDGWRIESAAYPELTEVGAWRGPDDPLPPQMGTGRHRYGGCYTQAEVSDLVQHLAGLGVEVVPEMDLPGHARALLKSRPELAEADDASVYRSVQHYDDNVINSAFGTTMACLNTLISEWCDLFPGSLFHLGCDEVPEGAWSQSPAALEALQNGGVSPLVGLIADVSQLLKQRGKTLAGWEEIVDGQPRERAWIYSWQGTEAGQAAADMGHSVIMTPAQHCYLDLAVTEEVDDPGYWWAGTVDMRRVYDYQPRAGMSEQAAAQVKGVQYCLWTELIDSTAKVEFMWFPRLLAGAEVVWGSNTNETYEAFERRAEQGVQLLLRLGLRVRCKKMSW